VDLMSFSGHKIYGPKGVGALYVRQKPRLRLEPLIHGGGQELGLRSGTLPTHQIVGMGEAFKIAQVEMSEESQRILQLRTKLWDGINPLKGVGLNGDLIQRIPGNLNVNFQGVDGESLLVGLKDLAVSTGSACTSASIEPSYVLRALGLSDHLAHSSLRFSLGRFTTDAEIKYAIEHIHAVVEKLRAMAP
jgi:cysteine desulfurase